MSDPIAEFQDEFFQDVLVSADASGQLHEDTFFQLFTDYLVETGELETADRASYTGTRGVRIDGYGGDPIESGTLSLIIVDTDQTPGIKTLTATEMDAAFKRASSFLSKALDPGFRSGLDEASPAYGLSDLISARWPKSGIARAGISKVKLVLVTDKLLSSRVDGRAAELLDGVPVVHSVWDIGRLFRLVVAGRGREEIQIDLVDTFGSGIPALAAHHEDASFETYLMVLPGEHLAQIYDRWGARLLEQNVRVFLQALGNVNKGIRNTIENEPEMFLAYNNGITATAESVETHTSDAGLLVTRLHNLQIVNGGQTTASIHAAMRRKVDLSEVFVQMKLSIIPPELATYVVPKISEYANSQNKVNAADFFANHPFHVRIEGFSRRISAPSPDGSFRESKWFYERARGQYQDERSRVSGVKRREFETEFPKSQLFTKTDLAKYLMVWRGEPHTVSKGAQKNFAAFAQAIGREWDRNSDQVSEVFYRDSIAKAIIFRETERLVSQQTWYAGGYRANIVAYTLAKIGHDLDRMGRFFDFGAVWTGQRVGLDLQEVIVVGAEAVQAVLVDPPASHTNITEWAKQQACWDRVRGIHVDWPVDFLQTTLTSLEHQVDVREGAVDMRLVTGIEAQTQVVGAGAAFWQAVLDWGRERKLLSAKEASILQACAGIPRRVPSDKQSYVALATLANLQREGCQLDLPHA
jgi:hypothetical protein